MAEARWSEDKGRVDAHLARHDGDISKHEERVTRVVTELHLKIDAVKASVGKMQTTLSAQAARIETKLDLVHSDVKNGSNERARASTANISAKSMIIVAVIAAVASMVVGLLRSLG